MARPSKLTTALVTAVRCIRCLGSGLLWLLATTVMFIAYHISPGILDVLAQQHEHHSLLAALVAPKEAMNTVPWLRDAAKAPLVLAAMASSWHRSSAEKKHIATWLDHELDLWKRSFRLPP